MIDGNQGQNVYPDADNYPDSSFPQPVPAPQVDPDDAGTLITVGYSWHWREVLMAAVDQLLNPATWEGEHDEIILALNRAANLKDLLGNPQYTDLAPYWDSEDGSDLDGAPSEDDGSPWYYKIISPDETLQENIEDWFIAAYVGIISGPQNALLFLTIAHQFRLEFKADPFGGILDIFINTEKYMSVDTYSPEPIVISRDVILPPESEFRALDVVKNQLLIVSTDEHNPASAGYQMAIVRKRLDPNEVSNPNIRWSEDCDCVQTRTPGTDTWVDNPGADPRNNPAGAFPPRTGGDPRCDAAANMRAKLEVTIGEVISGLNSAMIANSLLDVILLFVPGFAGLIALIWVVSELLFTIGVTVIDEAMTEDVYDELECIFYCNINSDGSVDAAIFDAISAQVASDIGGTAQGVYDLIVGRLWGVNGLNNAGATGAETGDCDDCDCGPLCFIPDAGRMYQVPCTSVDNHLLFDSLGAYSNVSAGNSQGAYVDLSSLKHLPSGAIGWKVSMSWINGTPSVFEYATAVDPSRADCVFNAVTLTATIGLLQAVPADHPIVWIGWPSGDFHVTEVCVESDFG